MTCWRHAAMTVHVQVVTFPFSVCPTMHQPLAAVILVMPVGSPSGAISQSNKLVPTEGANCQHVQFMQSCSICRLTASAV